MADFKQAYEVVERHEGGYVFDKDDVGLETFKGVSRKYHPNWTGWQIIDRYKLQPDFPRTLELSNELEKEVEYLYKTEYWNILNCDKIENQQIATDIFDFGVNAGIKPSIKVVQSILNIEVDGFCGNKTIKTLNSYDFEKFVTLFQIERIQYYIERVKERPSKKKFFYGWVKRVFS